MSNRVLVIDNTTASWNRCSVLSEKGYSVDLVRTSDAGLQRLSAERHDVIVVQETPEAKSWQLCERIRRVSTKPLIVISPNASVDPSVQAINADADYFMRKPCGLVEFSARVQSLLRRASVSQN